MTDLSEAQQIVKRVVGLPERIGEGLAAFGGFIRCETCGDTRDMNAQRASHYTAKGWPTCHGQTMRWWTQRQIDAGEVTR